MDKHVIEWLGAYQDGELQPALVKQVQDHLAECNHCRQELASIKNLSILLRSQPVPTPDLRKFTARLNAQLPARPVVPSGHHSRQVIWWLIPVLVVVVAMIIQIASGMTLFMLVADRTGLLGNLGNLIPGGDQIATSSVSWTSLLALVMEGDLGAIFVLLQSARQSVDLLFSSLSWQLGLALIYIAWLVVVWNNRFRLLETSAGLLKSNNGSIGV